MTTSSRHISLRNISFLACLATVWSFSGSVRASGQAPQEAAAVVATPPVPATPAGIKPVAPTADAVAPVAAADAAQQPAVAAAPSLTISAPSAAPGFKFKEGAKYSVSGIVDGYFNYDGDSPSNGNTQLRNFDLRANAVSLTEAKVVLAYDPAPFGIRADIGLGSALETMHPANPSGTGLKYVEQMFVTVKPAKWKGFQADFGQFVTSAGAEVIESADNWNYSRSFLFSYAIPYYHFGLRASMPVTSTITAGVQVVQGWNNIFDNNSRKTFGFTGVQAKKYYTLSGNYYVGPENDNSKVGYRNLIDTTLLLTPTAKFNAYINYDYGQNRNMNAANTATASLSRWQGIAFAAHGQLTPKITGTARFEYFIDPQGFATGTAQHLNEFTVTADYLLRPGFLIRSEFRQDHSDQRFFQQSHTPTNTNFQPTIEVAFIAFFGPKT